MTAPEEQSVVLQARSLSEHGQHGCDPRAGGDEQAAPARVGEPEAAQGQLHHCLRARVRVLNELGTSAACPGGDEQTKTILLQPRDRVVTPCVIAHVQTGELPWRPRADPAVQLQLRLPHAGSQAPFGDQGGEVLALGQWVHCSRLRSLGPLSQGGGDSGIPAGPKDLARGCDSAHHGSHDAGAPGVLAGEEQTGDGRARPQGVGPEPQRSGRRTVEGPGGMSGVVLVGQRSGGLHVVHELGQPRGRALSQLQHALGDALLESEVLGAAVFSGLLGPLPEGSRVTEGDELGGMWGLAGLQRGEGDEDVVRAPLEQRIAVPLCALVIEVPVHPDVSTIDADAARVITQA